MVKKKSPAKKKTKSVAKKPAATEAKKQDAGFKFNKKILLVLVPILLIAGFIGYNKYLDYRNVQDMKQVISVFEKQIANGSRIEKVCRFSGEKFNQKEVCSLFATENKNLDGINSSYLETEPLKNYCGIGKDGEFRGIIYCTIVTRPSTEKQIFELVSEY